MASSPGKRLEPVLTGAAAVARYRALADLSDRLRFADDPEDLLWIVSQRVGEELAVARCAGPAPRRAARWGGGGAQRRSGPRHEFTVALPLLEQPAPAEGEAGPETGSHRAAGLRILVVEDHADSAEMLAYLLRLEGHEVRVAADGAAAIELAPGFGPEVVLCDIGLPGMNGYDVAARLSERPEAARTRLVALSGYGQAEDRRRSHEAGFDFHLTKPVEPDALVALLASLRDARE